MEYFENSKMVLKCTTCNTRFHQKLIRINDKGVVNVEGKMMEPRFVSKSGELLKDHMLRHKSNRVSSGLLIGGKKR